MLWKQAPWRYLAENDYVLESSNPSSMVWHDGELWVGDWLAQTIDRYAFQGKHLGLVRKYYLPGVHLSGFAIAGEKMYLCDSWKKTVQRRKLDEALTVERVFPVKQRINNLFWDGKYLWSCGPGGAVSRHKPDDSLTVLARFKLSNEPDQIYKDSKFFWSASSGARRIYKHQLDNRLSVVAEYEIAGLESGAAAHAAVAGHPLSAFAWHEGKLWITLEGRNLLMKRSPGRLHPFP